MLLPILLLSAAATLPPSGPNPQDRIPVQRANDQIAVERAQDLLDNTCYKIRAYVFSQERSPQFQRMVTCVPANRTSTKRASGARLVPLGRAQSK
jgi:hypothetical protein